jgi:hypothetical protein
MLLILTVRCGHARCTEKVRHRSAGGNSRHRDRCASLLSTLACKFKAVALAWTALLGAGVAQSWSGRVDTSK